MELVEKRPEEIYKTAQEVGLYVIIRPTCMYVPNGNLEVILGGCKMLKD